MRVSGRAPKFTIQPYRIGPCARQQTFIYMRIFTFLLCWIALVLSKKASAQTFTPALSQPNCPSTAGVMYTISNPPVDFSNLQLINCIGCTIVLPIDANGNFTLTFQDTKNPHTVTLNNLVTGVPNTLTFAVSTLVGITPMLAPGQSLLPPSQAYTGGVPSGYAAVLNANYCTSTVYLVTAPLVYYQYMGNNYGFQMTTYQWKMPSGWSINDGSTTTVSNGSATITTHTNNVGITPDPLSGAGSDIEVWALNDCSPTTLAASSHMKIAIYRANTPNPLALSVNGANPFNLNCNDFTPVTFTFPNLVPCATGYKWTIPNGWTQSDGTVGGSVTTTTPSITLTPNTLGSDPGDVTMTLLINGVPKTTYTETTNYVLNPPTTTISGNVIDCGSATYTVSGLPAGSGTPVYSVAPVSLTGNVTTSQSGNTLTVNQNGSSGSVTITASTPTPCGTSTTAAYQVNMGVPEAYNLICETAGEPLNSGDIYNFVAENLNIYNNPSIYYFWSCSGGTISSGQGTSTASILVAPYYGPKGTYGTLRVSVQEQLPGCTSSGYKTESYLVANGSGPAPPDVVRLTPNPASDRVSILLSPESTTASASPPATKTVESTGDASFSPKTASAATTAHLKMARVYDLTGRLIKTAIYPATGVQELFDVHDLASGVYLIQLFLDNHHTYTQKLIIQH